jgi:hypothetical protein
MAAIVQPAVQPAAQQPAALAENPPPQLYLTRAADALRIAQKDSASTVSLESALVTS